MILKIKVKPNSGKQDIEKIKDNEYKVSLKSIPEDNKANLELIKLMKKNLNISSKNIKIIKGLKSRKKILEFKN